MTLGEAPGFVRDERDRDLCSEFVALLMHPAESCAESTITVIAQGCQRPAPAHPAARLRCPSVNPISVLARRDWERRVGWMHRIILKWSGALTSSLNTYGVPVMNRAAQKCFVLGFAGSSDSAWMQP